MVEPKAKDDNDEEELRQRGGGERSRQAQRTMQSHPTSRLAGAVRGEDEKSPLENPTCLPVFVRQRIRRWGGYLYNIDLFPYVERRLLAFIEG